MSEAYDPPAPRHGLWLLILGVAAAAVVLLMLVSSTSFHRCVQDRTNDPMYRQLIDKRSRFFIFTERRWIDAACAAAFANANQGALSALFAVFLVVVGGLQVLVYFRQAHIMRLQLLLQNATLKATNDAAVAAKNSADVASRTLSDVERPWVVVLGFGHEFREYAEAVGKPRTNAWFLSMRWKNIGRMPAIVEELVVKVQDIDTLPPTPDYSGAPPMGIERVIAAGAETEETQGIGPGLGSGMKDGKAIQFVAFGRLTYKELSGKVHHTGFAVRVNPHFAGTASHNNTAYEYWD
jgi:hypothetical protein